MKYIFISLLLLLITSCKSEQKIDDNTLGWKLKNTISLKKTILNSDLPFKHPFDIEIWKDYLIIYDKENPEYLLHIYSLKGDEISHFCRKGKGPAEIASPTDQDIQIIKESGTLVFQDKLGKKLVYFKLDNVLNKTEPAFYEKNLPNDLFYIQTIVLQNGNYLNYEHINSTRPYRFSIYDSSFNWKSGYINFPVLKNDKDTKQERIRLTNFFHSVINSDNQRFVIATRIGIKIEFFKIYNNSDLSLISSLNLNKGKISSLNILGGKFNIPMPARDGILGFQDVCAHDSLVFAIFLDRTYDENLSYNPNKIISFNWQGEVVNEYISNEYLTTFVSKDDSFYGISINKEGSLDLIRLDIK